MNKTVKTLIKIGVCIGAVAGTMYAINKFIENKVKSINKLKIKEDVTYKWSQGNIYYEKTGEGSPILLIHDFTPYASSYEWINLVELLAEHHTVYTIDLLGCGRSDKPAITYTNFMYVQMITDFINDIIGEKTNIVTSGHASSLALMSTNYTCEYIGKLVLINPADIQNTETSVLSKITKTVLSLPLIGTFTYNMITLRKNIESILKEEYFYRFVDDDILDVYYESAHLKHANGRYVMASILGNYMEANVYHALEKCEQEIYIISGEFIEESENVVESYSEFKEDIYTTIIEDTKKLPHYEAADVVAEKINKYLA